MTLATETTTALLDGLLGAPDGPVWDEFTGRYRPVLLALARRVGLPDDAAEDAAQEALAEFVEAYRAQRYDRSRGRLSGWLIGIARHRIQDVMRRRFRDRPAADDSILALVADERRISGMWEDECRREILRRATAALRDRTRMDPRTIRAFEMLACEGADPATVARALDVPLSEVYVAKHRALDRLREMIAEFSRAFESDASE